MTSFEIVAGSYEEFVLGYIFSSTGNTLKASFASHDHSASVRCVAVSGNFMASGGADDRIIIYDLKSRKEHCMLTQHNATVNCLQFTKEHSHILAGSADGVLSIVRVGNWQLEKQWDKAHKGQAVLDVALHSSGKLALTLGADCTLCTWNLVKGRKAYILNLNTLSKDAKSLEKIVWAEDGVRFILYGGRYTEIWKIDTGGILKAIDHSARVTSCIWLSDDEILVGYEDGQLSLINISSLTRQNYKAHGGRIKALLRHQDYIISASSTGELKVWSKDIEELACISTGCRLTCLSVIPGLHIKTEETKLESVEIVNDSPKKPVQKSTVVIEIDDEDDNSFHITDQSLPSKRKRKHKKKSVIQSDVNTSRENESSDLKDSTEKEVRKIKKNRKNIQGNVEDSNLEIEEDISNHNNELITQKHKKKNKRKNTATDYTELEIKVPKKKKSQKKVLV